MIQNIQIYYYQYPILAFSAYQLTHLSEKNKNLFSDYLSNL